MARSFRQMAVVMIIPAVMAVSLMPRDAKAWVAPPWIDKIALMVMEQKNLSTSGDFAPYFKQLETVSEAAVKGEYNGKRKGMNRFLEMLETKEGGPGREGPGRAHETFCRGDQGPGRAGRSRVLTGDAARVEPRRRGHAIPWHRRHGIIGAFVQEASALVRARAPTATESESAR
ncbi:MAG: hypothetical protein DYH03_20095 [Nitrospira sp. NTP1]|nr:hypothetical protein [Nitrospira sp. NTP1]